MLSSAGFAVCGVYLVDSIFVTDASKLIAGNLMALSAMVHLELPHINVLSKCDLIDKTVMERYLAPAGAELVSELHRTMGARFRNLNEALARIVSIGNHELAVCLCSVLETRERICRPLLSSSSTCS